MPTNIPYHAGLAIGQVVTEKKIDNLIQISALQATADAAEEQLKALISLKRSIDITAQELRNMNIDASVLAEESQKIDSQIKEAAENARKIKNETEKALYTLQSQAEPLHYQVETPVDFHKSQIQQSQLSADSIKMNCEYIPLLDNDNSSVIHGSAITSFVNETIGFLGEPFSSQINSSIQNQLNDAASKQAIAGTLVIAIACTQRNAITVSPLVIDADKAIRAWNSIFPKEVIHTDNLQGMAKIAAQMDTDKETSFKLITGAAYASCFVGMIHIVKASGTITTEALRSIAETFEHQFRAGSWMGIADGDFGVDAGLSSYNKKILNLLPDTALCTTISLGATSVAKSNQMKQLLQQSGNADLASIAPSQNVTANVEHVEEKVININEMLNAIQEYVSLCTGNGNGMPINYYLKSFTKSQLAQIWLNRNMSGLQPKY